MKTSTRRLTLFLAVASVVSVVTLTGCALTPVANVVPDPDFQSCLNGYLHRKSTAPISASQLANLSGGITCVKQDWLYTDQIVASLEGAQYLTSLTSLSVPTRWFPTSHRCKA